MSRDVMTPEYRAASGAVVLAADEAGYLTGQILHPSGGWVSG